MGDAALAGASGDDGAGGGDFAAEVGGIDLLTEDGFVDGAEFGHGEFGLQEAEGEVGVVDFAAQPAEAVGDDFFVVEGEGNRDFVDVEPVDAAGAGSGAELMLAPANEGEIGDGDAVLAGIAVGTAEGVELLEIVGLEAGLVEKLPAGGLGEGGAFVDPAAGKGPAAAVGGAIAKDQ